MTNNLPYTLYSSEQTRFLYALAESEVHIPGIQLMKRAGQASFDVLIQRWKDVQHIVVFCGGGNNGGDGYVLAALVAKKKIPVTVCALVNPERLKGNAKQAYLYALQERAPVYVIADGETMPDKLAKVLATGSQKVVVVDAVLGTGFVGDMRDDTAKAIDLMHACCAPILALDIPSGLQADTGFANTKALKVDATVTFIALKLGLLTGRGPALCGDIYFDDLKLPEYLYGHIKPVAMRIDVCSLEHLKLHREADAHKGDFGHVRIVGGDKGLGGAALMAAEAAARSGAGVVSLATQPEHVSASLSRMPEVMVLGVSSSPELEERQGLASVLAIGPGLGQSAWSEQMLAATINCDLPMVVDADALNLIASTVGGFQLPLARNIHRVFTPHPGEAARLLASTVADIQCDRIAAAKNLQQKLGGVVVLKGAGTVIASDGVVKIANVGNPGMAVAGMGDILAGIIAALMAQGLSALDAAYLGVCVHGKAGDLAAKESGVKGILATDLLPFVRKSLN
ncbi:MAG: hydroxyethylthiazole kinase-like uncharacterized protein yjeF [Lentisphaeria bacterium]|jgi:hydroxyethylthiazole kinase-like uncharacterized protein yjeF